MLGVVQNKEKEIRKASLIKETAQVFWMQDLIELKYMHPSNPAGTCNLSYLPCMNVTLPCYLP